jgi:hypothetical protein
LTWYGNLFVVRGVAGGLGQTCDVLYLHNAGLKSQATYYQRFAADVLENGGPNKAISKARQPTYCPTTIAHSKSKKENDARCLIFYKNQVGA